ncbi:MAG TPA: DUF992 domain-containing protein [Rhizobium sp.]
MKTVILIAAACALAIATSAHAETSPHPKKRPQQHEAALAKKERLGTLSCDVAGGVGMLIGSSKAVDCEFIRSSGRPEHYRGSIGKLGIDIGITNKSYLRWIVYSVAANRTGEGALAGSYVGATAGASVGLGLGANALVGGNSKNFGLQPLSAEAGTGLNIAAGVARLELHRTK